LPHRPASVIIYRYGSSAFSRPGWLWVTWFDDPRDAEVRSGAFVLSALVLRTVFWELLSLEVVMVILRLRLALALVACGAFLAGCADHAPVKEATEKDPAKKVAEKPAQPAPGDPEKAVDERIIDGKPLSHWIAQLQDKDRNVRMEAVQTLGGGGPRKGGVLPEQLGKAGLQALGQALRDKDSGVRFIAFQSLQRHGASAAPFILDALKDQDPAVRIDAAGNRFLSMIFFPEKPDSLVTALCELLMKDKEIKVRQAAVSALVNCGEAAAPGLIMAAKSGDADARRLAVRTLGGFAWSQQSVVAVLIDVLQEKGAEKSLRMEAVTALRGRGSSAKKAVPFLVGLLKDEDENLRSQAAQTLGILGNDAGEALPDLLLASKVDDVGGKSALDAIQSIMKAPRSAAPALLALLKDPEPYIQLKAITVLCDLEEGDKECLAALLELVKRRNSKVRRETTALLTRYGSAAKDAVPALIEILRTESDPRDGTARHYTIIALGNIGPDAKAAIPALKAVLEDKQVSPQGGPMELAIKSALKKIEQ
jgi:HEAT repeat protein